MYAMTYCRVLHLTTDEYTQKQDIVIIQFIRVIHVILNYAEFVLIGFKIKFIQYLY